MDRLIAYLCLCVTASLWAVPAVAVDTKVSGVVHVVDGDTIDVGSTRIRLFGIDAPETDQTCIGADDAVLPCGAWVTAQVRATYQGQQAICARIDTDRYGRTVARCSVAGNDMGQALVARGLAFSYTRYSRDYIAIEASARRATAGIHAYKMLRPADYRKARKVASVDNLGAGGRTVASDCLLKGNINAKGDRIFHVPGQRDYSKTRINLSKGERWFCTAGQARAAGWRAARR